MSAGISSSSSSSSSSASSAAAAAAAAPPPLRGEPPLLALRLLGLLLLEEDRRRLRLVGQPHLAPFRLRLPSPRAPAGTSLVGHPVVPSRPRPHRRRPRRAHAAPTRRRRLALAVQRRVKEVLLDAVVVVVRLGGQVLGVVHLLHARLLSRAASPSCARCRRRPRRRHC